MATSNNTKKRSQSSTGSSKKAAGGAGKARSTSGASKASRSTSSRGVSSRNTYSSGAKATRNLSPQEMELWYEVGLIILFAFMVFLFLCNLGLVGPVGVFFKNIMFGLFGFAAYIMPILLFLGTFFVWVNKGHTAAKRKVISGIVLFCLLCAVGELTTGRLAQMESYNLIVLYQNSVQYSNGGGVLGGSLAYFLNSTFDMVGSILILFAVAIICLVLITEKSFVKGVQKTGIAVAGRVRTDARNMREYATERSQKREEMRYEQMKLEEESLQGGSNMESFRSSKGRAQPAPNSKVKGIDFRAIFSGLEKKAQDHSEDNLMDNFKLEDSEEEMQNVPLSHSHVNPQITSQPTGNGATANVVSLEAARGIVELKRGVNAGSVNTPGAAAGSVAAAAAVQVSRETVAKALEETDELHELRPKGSYHQQERIHMVGSDVKQKAKLSEDREPIYGGSLFDAPSPEHYHVPEYEEQSLQSQNYEPQHYEPIELTYSNEQSQVSMVEAHKEEPANADHRPKAVLREKDRLGIPGVQTTAGAARQSSSGTLSDSSSSLKGESFKQPAPKEKPYLFPPISLLQKGKNTNPRDGQRHLEETARRLQECLRTFGVNVTITDISQGPAVTRYELQPEQGVKVSKIVNLSDDIKLNLAATDIRIEAPIPGKSAIGIEVPNKENSAVAFRELIESQEFQSFGSKLAFAVGKDIAGKIVVSDIAKMPHMLIAGATGSGKSVCINTLIMSILYKAHPDEVKLIMIDPKVVELSSYNGIPHLLIPVVTDPKQAAGALQWGVSEMMARYEKFAEYNVRDMKGFNAKIEQMTAEGRENLPKKLPQIVIIVDELADLMMVAPGEVEEAICRLAQLARAAGIHLIIATQRPSVDVITGLIKANMPSRVAFAVSSGVDSRTILDMNGAEKLLGKGDMLFYPQGYSKPVRVQGSFVSDGEVGAVVDYLKNQQIGNVYQEEVQNQINNLKSGGGNAAGAAGGRSDDKDALFAEAGRFIIEKDKASIGMLQRVFKIGFNRAARIVDQLCEYGVVGDEEGTKPRKVLMSLEQFENLLEEI